MTGPFPVLAHDLAWRLDSADFEPDGQTIYVGTRPFDDGWVAAVIRIDGCGDEGEALWLGKCVHADVLAHLRFVNQQQVPSEAVDVETGVPPGGVGWSVAVYVTLSAAAEAQALKDFLSRYAAAACGTPEV